MSSQLNTVHLEQIISYLQFADKMRKHILSEVKEEIADHVDSRVDDSETYTGSEICDALEDLPDLLDTMLDRELEHQRDVSVFLIQKIFEQYRQLDMEISLKVPMLENEKDIKSSHALCEDLTTKPAETLKSAPLPPKDAKRVGEKLKEMKSQSKSKDPKSILEENLRLKKQIQDEMNAFPQYKKLQEMIHEREIELNGLKACL
ncbi:MGC81471 protein, putative [Trichomonas vaginalis G3]|uniref:Leucine zipper transcription factor-like protein 1 n=1 Tax=Trichomonas vaginalis (strain ATCC PRA-98 / G3) TaxID=412133 RepID=A2F3L9_TRIV3|nr:leucine zipper transcription factor like family [Trichomonas vaginalis G3]EAY00487.1 MGC81471 protein, putative [Trichomonas vaginalis G3]KAI5520555.1 leucine zipper transcription factor like family [Trichomonas vaginalis G3]|eukprot:XP_001313416.1 MGC81471 protein [Trichomonas vaginalis G3]